MTSVFRGLLGEATGHVQWDRMWNVTLVFIIQRGDRSSKVV